MKDILKAYDGLKCKKVCVKTEHNKIKCTNAILRLVGGGDILFIDALLETSVEAYIETEDIISITISYNPND